MRNILRSPIKSALTIAVALFFVCGLIWLQLTIDRTQEELDILYDTIPVTADIQQFDPFQRVVVHPLRSVVSRSVINQISDNEFVRDVYVVSGFEFNYIIPSDADGRFCRDILNEILEFESEGPTPQFPGERADWHFAVSCLETLIKRSIECRSLMVMGVSPFTIRFADGFDERDFNYYDRTLAAPIPVVVYERIFEKRGLELGGIAYIIQYEDSRQWWDTQPFAVQTQVIGTYSGGISGGVFHVPRDGFVLLPISALGYMRRHDMRYITAFIEIEPSKNHLVHEFVEQMSPFLNNNSIRVGRVGSPFNYPVPLRLVIHDDEFRNVVIPMEQNLELLWILYPIAIVVSVIIAAGFAVLLMLQNAKIAAIMVVLGTRRIRVRALLCAEQLVLTLVGILLGVAILPLLGMGFAPALLLPAGLYLGGAVVGAVTGAVIISMKSPLELLQVRE